MRVSLWCLLSCLYDSTERQLHNNNGRGISIQVHAHQLHINNCWGINCVIIPAPMVILKYYVCKNCFFFTRNSSRKPFFSEDAGVVKAIQNSQGVIFWNNFRSGGSLIGATISYAIRPNPAKKTTSPHLQSP